jgi:hypothetical protein
MAVTNVTAGLTAQPQTTTGAEVSVLAATTTSGVYVFETDLSAMVNGSIVELRLYLTIGGSERLAYYAIYAHIQAQPIKLSVPVPLVTGDTIRYTIMHGSGSGSVSTRTRAMTIG